MKKKFWQFLKDNDCLIDYLINCTIPECKPPEENWLGTKSKHPIMWINHSFYWMETTEGHHFWDTLDNKWKDICNG